MYRFIFLILISSSLRIFAQEGEIQKLNELIIETKRISLPFSELSHSISVEDSLSIYLSATSGVDEILQNVNSVDIRRRGIEGMQSDLYIRGGNFEQVLLLIDGVKMDDLQTGHHLMNASIQPEEIERIEIIKGSYSRIYGQNAMNGAINIITKKYAKDKIGIFAKGGSYNTFGAGISIHQNLKDLKLNVGLNKSISDGYRYNTDFDNWNGMMKISWKNMDILTLYSDRKFGANGFYASPLFKQQYEETNTWMFALKNKWNFNNIKTVAQIYFKSNDDHYVLNRNQPEIYENYHTNYKFGISWDGNIRSDIGTTGVGLDLNKGVLESSNLGEHERYTLTTFLEQRIKLGNKWDLTPGISVNYYNDFGWFLYPGFDIGYKIDRSVKLFFNTGITSRIPTFTNLYYKSSNEEGNTNLKPEKAYSSDLGVNLTTQKYHANLTLFARIAEDLIDWTKEKFTDKWHAENFGEVQTYGLEFSVGIPYKVQNFIQNAKVGYTIMDEIIVEKEVAYSRYSLNSFKHQLVVQSHNQFIKNISQYIVYRFNERTSGESYHVFDAALNYHFPKGKAQIQFNNIFDTEYSETNLVPMPYFHLMANIHYNF